MQAECRSRRVQQRLFAIPSLSVTPSMGDSTNQKLLALVLEAQQYALHSAARQQALTRLVIAIGQSGRLARLRKYAQYFSASAFEDLYNEALQEMYFYICNKIDLYRSDHPVMAWVNSTLSFKFQDVMQKRQLRNTLSYDPVIIDQRPSNSAAGDDADYQRLRLFLETDPEGLLATYSVRNYPEVTFQVLAIARHLQGNSWKDLSAQTQIPLKTLSCFFNRTLQKLLPYFHKYL